MVLESLGLSGAEAAVYQVLVGVSVPSSSEEVAAAASLPQADVARGVSGLVSRGMARRTAGRPARYTAVEPDVAVGALIRERERQLAAARAELQELEDAYERRPPGGSPAELIEVVEGRERITETYHRLVASAAAQMRFFSQPPYFSNTPEDDAEQARRMAEGVTFRVVYHTDAITAPGHLAAIRRNIARGERARVTAALPMEMMIADDAQALIPLDPASLDAAYLIHSSSLLTALVALFETSWAHAMPVYLAISDGDEETAADRDALLSLLAGGLADKEILRHLGWSPRTLQRRVRSLYAQLGASTRFQAGLAAAERGWVRQARPQ